MNAAARRLQPGRAPVDVRIEGASRRLSKNLRVLRLQAGLTQAALGHAAGVTVETIARLERVVRDKPSANANPSLETLVRIAFALGAELEELFT